MVYWKLSRIPYNLRQSHLTSKTIFSANIRVMSVHGLRGIEWSGGGGGRNSSNFSDGDPINFNVYIDIKVK